MNHRIRTLLAAVFFAAFELFFTTAMAQISPLDLGLRDATDGIDRYRILYNTHVQANSMGVEVSYAGISKRYGLSQSKVKSILFRSRNQLREYLDKEGYVL